jgi:hypothetical protein
MISIRRKTDAINLKMKLKNGQTQTDKTLNGNTDRTMDNREEGNL